MTPSIRIQSGYEIVQIDGDNPLGETVAIIPERLQSFRFKSEHYKENGIFIDATGVTRRFEVSKTKSADGIEAVAVITSNLAGEETLEIALECVQADAQKMLALLKEMAERGDKGDPDAALHCLCNDADQSRCLLHSRLYPLIGEIEEDADYLNYEPDEAEEDED